MLEHALKLIWNRRRANALLVIEIAAAFVVTFVLCAMAVNLWSNYRRPLGFDYEDVWAVSAAAPQAGNPFGPPDNGASERMSGALDDILAALRALPRTEAVGPIDIEPFSHIVSSTMAGPDADKTFTSRQNRTTREVLQAVGVTLVDGRWFGPEDEGQDYLPVLVNRTFAELAFGADHSAIGERATPPPDPDNPFYASAYWQQLPEAQKQAALLENRIVGVIEDFRQDGEFSADVPYMIQRYDKSTAVRGSSLSFALKVSAGTDAGFEEQIVETIEAVAPGWTASVTPWAYMRQSTNEATLLPIKAATIVAVFFVALVVMGLIGVLWQDVVRRTQEIGLRRALGAGAAAVRGQIQTEMLVLGAFGVLIGSVVAVQFPLLQLFERIDWGSAMAGLALAAVVILALVALGALYPSELAARREPADALRYE